MADLNGIPGALWREVSLATHRLLMLDYDGTLAPFHEVRDEALPWPRSLELLRAIAAGAHTTVAIVSGRPLDDLLRLLGPLDAERVGEHGWERRERGGDIVREPLPAPLRRLLDAAEASARAEGWGERLERKRASLVLHVRDLPPAQARDAIARCERSWLEPASHPGLRLDLIDGGLELRARGHDKGSTVRRLLSRQAPGTLGVFVGDDVSDEDAFAAVGGRGFGVRVGKRSSDSLARAWLPSYEDVPGFLEAWLEAAGRPPVRGPRA
jgi:trehalose-phosphatase